MRSRITPMTHPTDTALAALAWQNECEGWRQLGLAQQGLGVFAVDAHPGLTCAWWQGSPLEMDHYLLAHPSGWEDPVELLAGLGDPPGTARSGQVLRFLSQPGQNIWRTAALVAGFQTRDAAPLMAAELASCPALPPPGPDVGVIPVTTREQHAQAIQVIHEVYGGSRRLSEFFNPLETVQIFLATCHGRPAASATLWPYAGAAGIFSVATRPRYRRRGLALQVVSAAMDAARQAGFEVACLRTTPNLFPLYARLGFRPVGEVQRWVRFGPPDQGFGPA
jgi:GNAT superfamily N-acetyltransferase